MAGKSLVEGFILAGGSSSRMGSEKPTLDLGGRSLSELISVALNCISNKVTLIGAKSEHLGRGTPVIPDIIPEVGALGGIHTALSVCRAPWAAVVACDLPFVSGQLFSRLWSFAEDFDAIVPIQSDGRAQPLCAIYHKQRCEQMAEMLINQGVRHSRSVADSVKTRWVTPEEVGDLPGNDLFFWNLNTPAELERAREFLKTKQSSSIVSYPPLSIST